MTESPTIREWVAEAEEGASVQSMAYADRLRILSSLNLFTVLMPALLATVSAVVGAIPKQPVVESLAHLPLATVLSAAAAIFITFHKSLKCDDYQAECRRLSQAYKAFAVSAAAALALPVEALPEGHERLSTQLAALTQGAMATVPGRYVQRAGMRMHNDRSCS
jgi:hypothetical protein